MPSLLQMADSLIAVVNSSAFFFGGETLGAIIIHRTQGKEISTHTKTCIWPSPSTWLLWLCSKAFLSPFPVSIFLVWLASSECIIR